MLFWSVLDKLMNSADCAVRTRHAVREQSKLYTQSHIKKLFRVQGFIRQPLAVYYLIEPGIAGIRLFVPSS